MKNSGIVARPRSEHFQQPNMVIANDRIDGARRAGFNPQDHRQESQFFRPRGRICGRSLNRKSRQTKEEPRELMNIAEIEEALRELAAQRFDPSDFPYRFLEIYDAPKATVTKLRQSNESDLLGSGDVLLKKKFWFKTAPKGKAAATVDAMAAEVADQKHAPRFILSTDGSEYHARDIKEEQSQFGELAKINDAFDFFLPMAGFERHEGVPENPADIKATARLAKLYDAILEANSSWIVENRTHELNLFMTRILFCFFAEDTSIFDAAQFTNSVMSLTRDDGSDTSTVLAVLFSAMNTPEDRRGKMPEYANRFRYVNGGLFKEQTPIPNFSKRARRLLKECGELHWRDINPDIFGSMIQAIVEPGMRDDMGMHYTSVPNIMKALQPLFLLSLEEEFEAGRDSDAKLQKLLRRIYSLRVFDPACGSGNFLIIAYRELRKLESRIFERRREIGQRSLPMTGISLSQFYGIELTDFAAETAKLSLWIIEYQMNAVFKAEFGNAPPALPLSDSGNILHENALKANWLKVCPPKEDSETYVVGNPPYIWSGDQSPQQKADLKNVFATEDGSCAILDYVSAWLKKGADYCIATDAQCAFVTTNSIFQGEQVGILWKMIQKRNLEIGFAHQSFKWKNLAAKNAGVTCVIVCLRKKSSAKKMLFVDSIARAVKNIGPYLIEMNDEVVVKSTTSLFGLPKMQYGNKPVDGGQLILTPDEKNALVAAHPESKTLLKRFYGSQEIIRGIERWCLWIDDRDLKTALKIPEIKRRVQAVRDSRLRSTDVSCLKMADRPHQFREMHIAQEYAIVVPAVSSEDREILPCVILDGESAVSNRCYQIIDKGLFLFSLIVSRLHYVWADTVGGKLETRFNYSNTIIYNTFPVPTLSPAQIEMLESFAWMVIEAREAHPGKTLAWLYDPETMPENVAAAHKALDDALEGIYIGRPFKNDTERLEFLFKQYSSAIKKISSGTNRELPLRGSKK